MLVFFIRPISAVFITLAFIFIGWRIWRDVLCKASGGPWMRRITKLFFNRPWRVIAYRNK